MKIGYDGKRAYQNKTGLGNYSRSLITILAKYYPQNFYTLFAPKKTGLFDPGSLLQVEAVFPQSAFYKKLPSLWRLFGMIKSIRKTGVDIYHGLSNELPVGVQFTKVKTVVTIHDLIFERFPETYPFDQRYVHRWKIKYACKVSDAIVAISGQTKNDLINLYKIPAEKIFISYQSCNPIFQRVVGDAEKLEIKKRYQLPEKYFLFVSSVTSRKNLIVICEALVLLKEKSNTPLVIIGNGKKQKREVKELMSANGMRERLIFLNEMPQARKGPFVTATDFPAIYQQALALIYPSIFEGFGLPLLEAMWSRLPVISSNTSSLPEAAGEAALYFSPKDAATLAGHMLRIMNDDELVENLRSKGCLQAQKFSPDKTAGSMMDIYQHLMKKKIGKQGLKQ